MFFMYRFQAVSRKVPTIGFFLLVVLVAGGFLLLRGDEVAYAANPNWPMLNYNTGGTRYNPNETILNTGNVGSMVQKWSFTTFAQGDVGSSPAEVNGIVYVGATDHDFTPGEVDALNAKTGAVVWKYTTVASIDASPAVFNGVVYIGTEDGTFYAFNAATGAVIWQVTLGSGTDPIHSSAVVVKGVVYVGSLDHNLYALSAATGAVVWKYDTGDGIYSSPAVANGVVYIVSNFNGTLFALRVKSGKKLWSFPLAGGGFSYSSPAVVNGVVFVWGMCGCASGTLYALNATAGTVNWSYNTSWLGGNLAIANGVVYLQSAGNLNALSASTGGVIWSVLGTWTSSSPAVANGVVYFEGIIGGSSVFQAVNAATGAILWSSQPLNAISDSPAVANGFAYVGDADGNLYAFHLP
jgi:outer membrane protein assembly factor BamB